MKLSTRSRYGTRILVDLALHHGKEPVPIRDIAEREGLSGHYVEQIIIQLKASGLIKSFRGARGGIILARHPSEVRLSEVFQVLEGPTAPVECVDDEKICPRSVFCVTREVWMDIKKSIDRVLEAKTLQDLANRRKEKEQLKTGTGIYYI